jgi:PAS domain-containing protein
MDKPQYQQFLQKLPFPALLGEPAENSQNHKVTFINQAFIDEFGFTLAQMPDKDHWWQLAYPDPAYRAVVASQWELEWELAEDKGLDKISMEACVTNKAGEEYRYRVISAISHSPEENVYQVFFMRLD